MNFRNINSNYHSVLDDKIIEEKIDAHYDSMSNLNKVLSLLMWNKSKEEKKHTVKT